MPFCSSCGKESPEGASFCTSCGCDLQTVSPPAQGEPPIESGTQKYEYKTITLAQKGLGLFTSRQIPELEATLNREARLGWRLCQIMMPSGAKGESDKVILVFEREVH